MKNKFSSKLNGQVYHMRAEGEITASELEIDLKKFKYYPLEDDGNKETDRCQFPLDAFPEKLQRIINCFHTSSNLPLDYYGLSILVVASAAIGNTFQLQIKTGFETTPIIFGALVGRSSVGKTPVLKHCLQPLIELEQNFYKEYLQELADWEEEIKQKGKENLKKPLPREILLNSATVEAINHSLQKNPKGCLLVQDELLGWLNSMNQYRQGNDLQFWLSIWSGSMLKVNRVTKDTILIPKPFLSVLGGIQPGVLEQLANKNNKNNGLLARILFAYPGNQKKPYESNAQLDPEVPNQYKAIILNLNNLINAQEYSAIGTISITLTKEAKDKYQKWQRKNTDLINEIDDDHLAAMYGKLEEYCLRFALILELLEYVCLNKSTNISKLEVNGKAIDGAISLTEYFRKTGEQVLNKVDKIDPVADLSTKKKLVFEKLPITFGTAEGAAIAQRLGMSERSFKRFLKDADLFKKIRHGQYEKC